MTLPVLLLLAACGEDEAPAPAAAPAPAPAPAAPAGGGAPGRPGGGAPGRPGPGGAPGRPGPPGPPGVAPIPGAPTPGTTGDDPVEPTFPAVAPATDGTVPVAAGWVLLGPRKINAVPGGSSPALNRPPPMPAPDAAGHAPGGPGRAPGGPPPIGPNVTPESRLQASDHPVPWISTGGQHIKPKRVWVDAFRIDRTEVTRAAYKEFLDATGYRPPHVDEQWAKDGPWNWTGTDFPPGTGDHPVVLASWYDATEYCAWRGKRLPGEAEWQLAALGPESDQRIFPWGNDYGGLRFNHGKMEEPNFDDSDGFLYTAPVGSFPAGRAASGAEDTFGNAWEFTADMRVDDWRLVQTVPKGDGLAYARAPGPGLHVAVRGGSYFFDVRPNPGGERNHFLPELRRKTSGFRCATD